MELAGQALNKNAVAVMPKNQWGLVRLSDCGDFLVQNLKTRIHMFLGRRMPLFNNADHQITLLWGSRRVIGRKLQIHMDDYGVGVRFICAVPQRHEVSR